MAEKLRDVVIESSVTSKAARGALGRWIAEMRPWSYFVTFTYDARKVQGEHNRIYAGSGVDRVELPITVGLQKIRKDMARFVYDVGRFVEGIDLVAGFEPHESGSLHAHGLVHPKRGPRLGDVWAIHQAWFPQHGYIKVDTLEGGSVEAAAKYAVKFDRIARYTTKHQGDIFFTRGLNGN